MTRSKDAFSWKDGKPPVCGVHSQVKLDILRDYIAAYFQTVAANPCIPRIPIHFVDAFAGGGTLRSAITGGAVPGSPFVILNAVHNAEQTIAASRKNAFCIDAMYHFADKCKYAIAELRKGIHASTYRERLAAGKIAIDRASIDSFLPKCLSRIPSSETTKAIFFLDQCGWNAATLHHCNRILDHLPKAEIIWNVSVESMANYANHDDDFRAAVRRFGVDLGDAFTSRPNFTHFSDWRKFLLMNFLGKIRTSCRARYVSPFMIQHDGWGYWLLHLSNHPQANNVMKGTHWQHQNDSLHEGFAGLRMLEFNRDNYQQPGIFRFDTAANDATHDALFGELMPRIRSLGAEATFNHLIQSVANETPADATRVSKVLADLRAEGELEIRRAKGEKRRSGPQCGDDRLLVPQQTKLFLPSFN